MKEATKQLGIRIPASQYLELKKIALENDKNLTDLIVSIFDDYLNKSIRGLCPLCHTQNPPDAQYCLMCGDPINRDSLNRMPLKLKRHFLNPDFVKTLYKDADIESINEVDEMAMAMNVIYNLQKQIDELMPIVEWAKRKMDEEK